MTMHSSTVRAALPDMLAFCPACPEPAKKRDCSGLNSLTPADDGDVFLIRACSFVTRSSPTPGVGLGEMVPEVDSVLCRIGYLSPLRVFAIFTHTGHV